MGMVFVVVQEPSGDLPECGDRIRKRVHANIVSLEGFDEALGDAIRFRRLSRVTVVLADRSEMPRVRPQ